MTNLSNGTTTIPASQIPPLQYISLYGYTPTLWICGLYIALFGLSTLIHVGQAVYFRLWWLFPSAVLAGLAETIGWSGRLWSSKDPQNLNPYLMQITTTIIAPTPLIAANFIILGHVIHRLGSQYSRLSPKMYTIIFLCCDLIALIVQAIGGAQASLAVEGGHNPEDGGHVMLGGIVFQMAAISIYVACAGEFLMRYLADRPLKRSVKRTQQNDPAVSGAYIPEGKDAAAASEPSNGLDTRMRLCLSGLTLSTTVIFIRSVYRTIELIDGWVGRVIRTQVYFNVLDAAMIVIAMFTLNVLHPGYTLKNKN